MTRQSASEWSSVDTVGNNRCQRMYISNVCIGNKRVVSGSDEEKLHDRKTGKKKGILLRQIYPKTCLLKPLKLAITSTVREKIDETRNVFTSQMHCIFEILQRNAFLIPQRSFQTSL